ncbi:ketopantoate reductase family protein [Paenibacillus hodogayensis]|uniref:2-dehydropantoate 2-reductase n=1 Tax=Paenibacillus hodogayensis TaxID=279208 RepID=A0ABV5VQF1_9BACL
MKIVCVGAGSIGLLVTAKLARTGADIALVAHSAEQADALNGGGLILSESGEETVCDVPALSFEELETAQALPDRNGDDGGGADWVLLTVKQKHLTERLLQAVSRLAGEKGRVLCFQNGIGHVERLAAHMPPDAIYLAVTTEGAKRLSGNRVAHTGEGITRIGPALDAGNSSFSPQNAEFAQKMLENALQEAGFRTFLSNQMREVVWNKLLLNAVINPLTALLRIRNGELPETNIRRGLMRGLLDEGIAVANAAGIATRGDLWEQLLDLCARTAANSSSMLQDLSGGRMTEIDWINGAILENASRLQLSLPLHETIYRLVKAAEPSGTPEEHP